MKYDRLRGAHTFSGSLYLTKASIASSRPFHYSQPLGALHCGKVSLESLARRFGTPLYVYSADQIVERLELFQQAFAGRDHLVCYAVKANSALAYRSCWQTAEPGSTLFPGASGTCWWPRLRLRSGSCLSGVGKDSG